MSAPGRYAGNADRICSLQPFRLDPTRGRAGLRLVASEVATLIPVASDHDFRLAFFCPPHPEYSDFPAGATFSQNLTILVSDPSFKFSFPIHRLYDNLNI